MERVLQFTGPNGCGKTSALRLLGGSPQLLSTLFQLPQFAEPPVRTSAIGFQAGQNVVFSRLVSSLLSVPLVFAGLQVSQANARVESILGEFDFQYLFNRDYLTLSGGERQFVALFSCLLSDVDLYLLDDPIVMMDQERAAKTLSVIQQFLAGRNNRRCAIASIRPDEYVNFHIRNVVHLGYSPNRRDCLEEFDHLICSLEAAGRRSSAVILDAVTLSPFGTTLLDHESRKFQSGELTVITGANGTGKSCLLHALGGIRNPNYGSITFLDAERERHIPGIGKNCVYLPQQFLNLLGFEMISRELGTSAAPSWWRQVLTFLYDWHILHPDLRVPESSLGERHFCNILAALAALARNPSLAVLLLDEPDSGLDDLRCALLIRTFHWLARQNYLVAVVSHRPHLYSDSGPTEEFKLKGLRLVSREAERA